MANERAVVETFSYGGAARTIDRQCTFRGRANSIRGHWKLGTISLVALIVSALLVGCGASEASQVAKYKEVNTRNASKLQQISADNACTTESDDMTACKASYQQMIDAIRTWKSELDSTRVPDCLKNSNDTLRQSLDLFDQGLTLMLEGIPDNMQQLTLSDLQNLSQGSDKVVEAGDKLTAAMSAAENANCAV